MENPQRKPPTAKEVLARQKADADRDRKQATAPPTSPLRQAVVPSKPTAVAAPDNRTAAQRYVDEIAPSSIVGRLVKFSKDGNFELGDTGEKVDGDTDFIALCDETLIGWIKFNRDSETPPDRQMGLLYDGYIMPERTTLGDANQALWSLGLSGSPEDPWKHQICLVLQTPGTLELFTFVTTSVSGRRAVGNLLRHYDRMRTRDPEHYPVVRLKVGGFNHRDERIGWVPVPTFAVCGKAPKTSAAVPDTSPAGDMSDSIPF